MDASTVEEYGWKLVFDEEGRIIAVPVEPPRLPRGYVEPPAMLRREDRHLDPENVRANRAGLGYW